MSARTAGIDSATDMILEEKLEYPEKIRDEEFMKKLTSTSTSASTSASYYYHQPKNKKIWMKYKNLEIYNIRKNIWRKISSTVSWKNV
jgi:hypothetical protein